MRRRGPLGNKGQLEVIDDPVHHRIDMEGNGEVPPAPISGKSYSGKFIVRIPPEIHRALAIKAAEEGISLNRLVSSKLTCL